MEGSAPASSTIIMDTVKYCRANAAKYVTGPFKNFVDSIEFKAPFGDYRKLCNDPNAKTEEKIAAFLREGISALVKTAFVVAAAYTAVQLVNFALSAVITTIACVILFEKSQDKEMFHKIAVRLKEFWDSVTSPAINNDEAAGSEAEKIKKTDKDQIQKKLEDVEDDFFISDDSDTEEDSPIQKKRKTDDVRQDNKENSFKKDAVTNTKEQVVHNLK
jgi:hypothetical protein